MLDPPAEAAELVFVQAELDGRGWLLFRDFVAEPSPDGGLILYRNGVPVGTAQTYPEARRRIETLAGLRTCATPGHAGPFLTGASTAHAGRRGTCGTCGAELSEAEYEGSRRLHRRPSG